MAVDSASSPIFFQTRLCRCLDIIIRARTFERLVQLAYYHFKHKSRFSQKRRRFSCASFYYSAQRETHGKHGEKADKGKTRGEIECQVFDVIIVKGDERNINFALAAFFQLDFYVIFDKKRNTTHNTTAQCSVVFQ